MRPARQLAEQRLRWLGWGGGSAVSLARRSAPGGSGFYLHASHAIRRSRKAIFLSRAPDERAVRLQQHRALQARRPWRHHSGSRADGTRIDEDQALLPLAIPVTLQKLLQLAMGQPFRFRCSAARWWWVSLSTTGVNGGVRRMFKR